MCVSCTWQGNGYKLLRIVVTAPPCQINDLRCNYVQTVLCGITRTQQHARSLLSIARLNIVNSRALDEICSLVRIAQISRSFNGGFWPVNFPLFHGTRRAPDEVSVDRGSS